LAVLGGKEAIREAWREAVLEAIEEALEEEGRKAKAPRRKAKAEEAELEAETPKAKAKATRRRGPGADSGEVRRLIKALGDLGALVGPREHELLARRAETLVRKAHPGKGTQVLAGVLEYLRTLTTDGVAKAARLGYFDLAQAAGVANLVEPPKGA